LPKILNAIQKHAVAKKTLNFAAVFNNSAQVCYSLSAKTEVVENFEYLGEFKKGCRKCWLYHVRYLLMDE
jgi:hypothetical protein